MRQVTRKGLITMAAAGGALALGGGYAHAGAGAAGGASDSPGVASGNTVQVPVSVPVNACGNTVNVVGLLNPAAGNTCANKSGTGSHGTGPGTGSPGSGTPGSGTPGTGTPGSGTQTGGGSHASGSTSHSPGVGSGNVIQAPVDVPVNACGNTVDIVGLLNPAAGNNCGNNAVPPTEKPEEPVKPGEPGNPGKPREAEPSNPGTKPATRDGNDPVAQAAHSDDSEALAHTGAGSLGMIIPAGAGLLLGGAVLYRRARASA
ncbi:chaplin [Streptomyces sp. NPDC051018]|uniref:chaplin n=1 Tax=Streptomyces sp. NPDC051018 TaxID=3365639 RepID=UPI0037B3F9F1